MTPAWVAQLAVLPWKANSWSPDALNAKLVGLLELHGVPAIVGVAGDEPVILKRGSSLLRISVIALHHHRGATQQFAGLAIDNIAALIIAAGLDSIAARGTSLAVIIGSALSGTWANLRKGNIEIPYAVLSGLAGVPFTFFGVWLSHQIPQRITVILFSFILFAIATQQVQKVRRGSAEH